jgi:predicted nucleic acid-binding Zn finger protein
MKGVAIYLYFNLIVYIGVLFKFITRSFLCICEYFILVFNLIRGLRKSIHIIGLEEKKIV